jgi:hypothetical protein
MSCENVAVELRLALAAVESPDLYLADEFLALGTFFTCIKFIYTYHGIAK